MYILNRNLSNETFNKKVVPILKAIINPRTRQLFICHLLLYGHLQSLYFSDKLQISSGQALLSADSLWGALRGLETFSQLVYETQYESHGIVSI